MYEYFVDMVCKDCLRPLGKMLLFLNKEMTIKPGGFICEIDIRSNNEKIFTLCDQCAKKREGDKIEI